MLLLTLNKSNGSNKKIYSPEKCRICLEDGKIPIFGINDISDDVTEFGNITISDDDDLPQYLCDACHTLLEGAILFRKTAKETDEVLRNRNKHLDSGSDENSKQDDIYIKTEYLEFNYSSDSESKLDDFDWLKQECLSEAETSTYYPTISEADTQESIDGRSQAGENQDDDEIMIIVSDKNKQKLKQNRDRNYNIDFNDDAERIEDSKKAHNKILPHQKECEVCHSIVLKSTYRVHLKEHREKYKENYNKKYSKVKCDICGKKISKTYVKLHMKTHEELAQRQVKCLLCNKMFSERYYNDHVKRVHGTKNSKGNKTIQDVEIQKPPKYNKCPVCDKYVKGSNFKLHVEKHGGHPKRYICDKCGKEFKHPSAFKTHYLTHGSELKYKCQFCPYKGLHQGLLKIHVRTHTGDYNYKCTECPAKFITKSNLSKHLQRHKGLFSYKCEFCGKGFYTKPHLEKHFKNVHTTTKDHVCEVCGKAFGHRDNMLSHQLKVHKRQKIVPRGRMPSYLKAELMSE